MRDAIAALFTLAAVANRQSSRALSLKNHIGLPSVNGRSDHFSADLKRQMIFVSALGNHSVEVERRNYGESCKTRGASNSSGANYLPTGRAYHILDLRSSTSVAATSVDLSGGVYDRRRRPGRLAAAVL